MNRYFWSAALLSTWLMLGLAGCVHQPPAGNTGITPEDLLAATLQPADFTRMVSDPQHWWPGFPRLNIRPAIGGPGCEAYAGRSFQKVADPAKARITTGLSLYCDPASAAAGMFSSTNTLEKGAVACDGPAVGESKRYFTRLSPENLCETALRFRVGRVVGRVSVMIQGHYEEPATLARYAEPVVRKVQALLDGKLHAEPFPQSHAKHMPSAQASARVGRLLGSAVIPVETLALVDISGQPLEVCERWHRLGIKQLGFRRYGVESIAGHVVETTLFVFPDDQSAAARVEEFRKQAVKQGLLAPGRLGALSAYTRNGDGSYYLQFAKGRYVADLLCYAPFLKVEPSAEPIVRKFAERWFAELPVR